jgi:hypothetical protein
LTLSKDDGIRPNFGGLLLQFLNGVVKALLLRDVPQVLRSPAEANLARFSYSTGLNPLSVECRLFGL